MSLNLVKTSFLKSKLLMPAARFASSSNSNKISDLETVVIKDRDVEIVDTKTHTGQIFEKDDYRLARFIDKRKEVNLNVAAKLIAEVAPKACSDRVVSCDGGDGPLGHPRVFINLDQPGNHSCGYCGLRFYLDHHH